MTPGSIEIEESGSKIVVCELCGFERPGKTLYVDGEPGDCCYICMPFVKAMIKIIPVLGDIAKRFWDAVFESMM